MTVRELEEQIGECIEIDTPFSGWRGEVLMLRVWQEHVWVMRQDKCGLWESVRPASVTDARASVDAERRIA